MKHLLIVLALISITQFSIAQAPHPFEGFVSLTDTLLKNEISTFNIKSLSIMNTPSKQLTLTEIPLDYCNETAVGFNQGSTYIHLDFSQNNSKSRQLASIFFVTHSHFYVEFPDSVYKDLTNIISYKVDKAKKKDVLVSRYFKSFQSSDRRRIYLYMIGGLPSSRYEVTWVVQNSRYLMRIVDSI